MIPSKCLPIWRRTSEGVTVFYKFLDSLMNNLGFPKDYNDRADYIKKIMKNHLTIVSIGCTKLYFPFSQVFPILIGEGIY